MKFACLPAMGLYGSTECITWDHYLENKNRHINASFFMPVLFPIIFGTFVSCAGPRQWKKMGKINFNKIRSLIFILCIRSWKAREYIV